MQRRRHNGPRLSATADCAGLPFSDARHARADRRSLSERRVYEVDDYTFSLPILPYGLRSPTATPLGSNRLPFASAVQPVLYGSMDNATA
jgi:hypothetical protein